MLSSHNTWEPIGNLACPRILHEFFLQRSLTEEKIVDVEVNSDKPYGFERGLAPTCITGVTKVDDELYFLIKWKGRKDPDVVPATQANVRCPQLVIGFYESHPCCRSRVDAPVDGPTNTCDSTSHFLMLTRTYQAHL
nr:unnamed protein product [Spirometra erinaceieuropaei]